MLNTLIRETCLKHSLKNVAGLKLNPDKPNDKAITRIQEKMLFKKVEYERPIPRKSMEKTLA